MANKITLEQIKAGWESLVKEEKRFYEENRSIVYVSAYSCEKYYLSERIAHRSRKEYKTWYFIGWSGVERINVDLIDSVKTVRGETYLIEKADSCGSVHRYRLCENALNFLLNGTRAPNWEK